MKYTIDELLRLACIFAERDQEEYLRCVSDSDSDEVEKTKDYLKQLRSYRMKRWGRTKLEAKLAEAVPMDVREVFKRMDATSPSCPPPTSTPPATTAAPRAE